ncbi:MAG: dTDP-4-dehydrorhamnose reductase [Rhizobiales bacterium]|nr:dTDP-4-dehydrorhamnose reductase [Hyphomicrobiales bacterium]
MRLLIAGWQGQLAQCLVKSAISHPQVTACAVGRPALDLCEMPSIQRNLSNLSPDVVINAAAYTAVDRAESEPEQAFALNRDGARMLAEAAALKGAAFIHISTDYVFDGLKPTAYIESDPTGPQGVYGQSKLAGEEAVLEAHPGALVMRTAWVYSALGRNFATNMLRLAREREEIGIVDDQRGSPTYAPHLADAVLATAIALAGAKEQGRQPAAGIFHAAGAGSATWFELAEALITESAAHGGKMPRLKRITTADYPTPARRPQNSVLDCSKLAEQFAIRLPHWREGVKACIAEIGNTGANDAY